MSLPAGWDTRYRAAEARLMSSADVLATRAALAPHPPDDQRALGWVGEPPTMGSAARVGVLAGSFNPLTPAHSALMNAAARTLRLSVRLWAFALVTVDKERVERATLTDRALQLQAYLAGRRTAAGLLVLRAGLYADQAAALRTLLPPGARLWLVVGYDKVTQIFDPRYYADRDAALRRLFAAAELAVAPRGAHHAADLAALLALPQNRPYAARVRLLPTRAKMAAASSTVARDLAARATAAAALAGLAEPEGAALALVTGAYSPPAVLPSGELVDRYALRQALINRLAARPGLGRHNSLAELVERACAPTAAGARLRADLRRDTAAR
jgi:nicotinic acid mononucleotide adenylyltransferase